MTRAPLPVINAIPQTVGILLPRLVAASRGISTRVTYGIRYGPAPFLTVAERHTRFGEFNQLVDKAAGPPIESYTTNRLRKGGHHGRRQTVPGIRRAE